jgi:hypothetical protein
VQLRRSTAPRPRFPGPAPAARLVPIAAALLLVTLGCERPPEASPSIDLSAVSATKQKVVYGEDDRLDVYQVSDPARLGLVDASVALVDASDLITNDPNNVQFDVLPLGQYLGLCSEEAFLDHPNAGFCSGSLIDDDLVLTAGHCIRNNFDCDETRFVFNLHYEAPGTLANIQLDRDVYRCEEILVSVEQGDLDFALIRLDRSAAAQGKQPVTIVPGPTTTGEDILLVGYPTGIPLKFDDGGDVLEPGIGPNPVAFRGTPDAFGGNSGSPVFNAANEQVGILVAGQTDYAFDNANQCTRVNVLGQNQGPGEVMTYAQRAIDTLCDDLGDDSPRLCPQNVNDACRTCPAEACPEAWSCGTHADNPNVSFCRQPCMSTAECSEGFVCAPDAFCSPTRSSVCQGDGVWEIDACDNLVVQTEQCELGCTGGTCEEQVTGDTCTDPFELDPLLPFQVIGGSTAGATDAYDNEGCNRNDGPEVVYRFTLEGPTEVEFYVDGLNGPGSSDPLIHLRQEVCDDVGTEIMCDDDGGQSTDSNWEGALEAGTYFLFLDSWGSSSEGNYSLEVSFQPIEQCEDVCALGELRCVQAGPPGIEACGPGPEGCTIWQFVLPCQEGCEDGECVGEGCFDECPFEGATACLNETTFGQCGQFDDDECLDALLETCGPDEQCIEGEGCVSENCVACEPDTLRCGGPDTVEVCQTDPDGCTFWEPAFFCDVGFCEDGQCVGECFDECFPGDEFCLDTFTFLPCGQFDGDACLEYGPPESCLPGTACEAGMCVAACGEGCPVGEERCRADGLLEACVLDDEGCSVWGTPFACEDGGVCDPLTGQCPDGCQSDCTLGEAECLSDSSYRVCLDEDGDGCASFTGPRFCFGATVCDEGLCVLEEAPMDAGPGPDVDAGPITFPGRNKPARVRIAPAANCAQSTPGGLLPLVGLLGMAALRRRRGQR